MSRSPENIESGVLKYELLLVLMSVLWGSTFVAQQIGMEKGVGPMMFNGLRFSLGCLALLPVLRWSLCRTTCGATESAGLVPWKGCIVAGLFLFAAASLQQIGLQYTSSANAGFITGFYLIFVPLMGLLLGHRVPRSLWCAIPLCLSGLYLLSVTKNFNVNKGDVLVLICAVLWAGQILVIGHVAKRGDPIAIALVQFVVCALLSLAAGLLFESCTWMQIRAAAGAIAYAGILSVGVAFTLQVVCQKRCPPAPAAIIMSMEAVFAALAGYLVLGQGLTFRSLVGCALILAGVLLVQLVPVFRKGRASNPPVFD